MPPNNSVVEAIKDRLSILDIVGSRVSLRKAGRNFQGLCPFHNEKTPSFVVFPDKGNFHCFGCGANGDVFTFVMRTENLDFAETLQRLAERAGVEVHSRKAASAVDAKRARLIEINATAAQYFQSMLFQSVGKAALDYLRGRGFTDAIINAYMLGFAPESWDALLSYLQGRGYEPTELIAAGVVSERESGGYYDRFRGRVMFPIRDEKGNVVGFGARVMGDAHPKYLNSPETEVFEKGSCLYGIDVARTAIREIGQAVVVEGYVDVLIAHQHGIKNVVASLGTALTERQVAMLKRLTRNVVLALDADTAGIEAARRGLDVARQVYSEVTPVPTWRGLVRYEQKLGADLRIAALPEGRDPDEIIRESVEEWRRIIASARPLVEYYLETTLAQADLASAKGKSAVAERVLPVVAEMRDPIQQAHYLGRLSEALGVREDVLASSLRRATFNRKMERGLPSRPGELVEEVEPRRRRRSLDEHLLGLLLRYEDLAPRVWDVDPNELTSVEAREALRQLHLHASSYAQIDVEVYLAELPEPLAEWVADVLAHERAHPALLTSQRQPELQRCLSEIRRANLKQEIARVSQVLAGTRESAGDDEARTLVVRVGRLLTTLAPFERDPSQPLCRNWRELVRQQIEDDVEVEQPAIGSGLGAGQ